LIKEGADVKTAAKNGETPLHAAVARGSAELVWALVEAGAEVNGVDCGGYTPLMLAVMSQNRSAIDTLLRGGADPNAERVDSTGHRSVPLMWALYPEVVELLLKHGADAALGDQPGRTVADYFLSRAELADSDPSGKSHAVRLRVLARMVHEHLR
jgi:ankyrin repeat protein